MCQIINFISQNVDLVNFAITSLLTIVLICYTVRISMRQNKLQKEISEQQNKLQIEINNQQSQLQKTITERETKINLYQFRMNCYLQVMEALDIIIYGKLEDIIEIFQAGGMDFIRKLSNGRKMMLKAYIESEPLFNEEVVKYIGGLYEKYNALYLKLCDIIMVSDKELEERQRVISSKLGITPTESKENIMLKWSIFLKTEEGKRLMIELIPGLGDYNTLLKELGEVFKSNNDLIKLMGEYINVKELNKI